MSNFYFLHSQIRQYTTFEISFRRQMMFLNNMIPQIIICGRQNITLCNEVNKD